MKKLILFAFILVCYTSFSQTYQPVPGYFKYFHIKFDSLGTATLPRDTSSNAPDGSVALKGSTLYVKVGIWSAITGAGGNGIWGFVSGDINSQADLIAKFATKMDSSRPTMDTLYNITDSTYGFYIHGRFYTFKARGAIPTFNGRSGNIILVPQDITDALGYTPSNLPNVLNKLQVINEGGADRIYVNAFTSRPSSGTYGRIFIATDSAKIYFDDGSTWVTLSGGGGGGGGTYNHAGGGISVTGDSLYLTPQSTTPGTYGGSINCPVLTINSKGIITLAGETTIVHPWGSLSGSMSSQLDLQAALDAKVATINGTSNRIDVTGSGVTRTLNISTSYAGQNSITTVGTLGAGATGSGFTLNLGTSTLSGTIPDANIASAATWNAKQAALISGTNIKTINGSSILGAGDLTVGGGSQNLQQVTTIGATTNIATSFDSSTHNNTLINQGLQIGDTLSNFTDSTLFVGNSIFFGYNASLPEKKATTLVSAALGSFEINKGVPGTTIAPGGSSIFNRLVDILPYRSTLRYIFIEIGINDRGGDTTTMKGYYNTLLDTIIIARGWPASRVVINTISVNGASGAANTAIISLMIKNLAVTRGIKLADVYSYQMTYGGLSNVSSDSLHPNDLGHLNMAKAMIYALNGAKTNGNLLVNGPASIKQNLSVGGNLSVSGLSSFNQTMSSIVPDVNMSNLKIYSPVFATGGQFNEIKFVPNPLSSQNDSFQIRLSIASGFRGNFDLMHNGATFLHLFPTTDNVSIGSNDANTYNYSPKLGVNGSIESTGPITAYTPANNTSMLRLFTGIASAVGQYNDISIIPGNSSNDNYSFRYEIGPSFNNNLQFRHNAGSVFRINESTNSIPFQFDVPGMSHAASTTSFPSFIIPTGSTPSSLSDGFIWHTSTSLYFRHGSNTYDLLGGGTNWVNSGNDVYLPFLSGGVVSIGAPPVANIPLNIVNNPSSGTAIRMNASSYGGHIRVIGDGQADALANGDFSIYDATTSKSQLRIDVNSNAFFQSGSLVVGASSFNASAILDINSTTKGVLIPRMTTTQKNAISSPAEGLFAYDNTLHVPYFYNGSSWTAFGGGGSSSTDSVNFEYVGIPGVPTAYARDSTFLSAYIAGQNSVSVTADSDSTDIIKLVNDSTLGSAANYGYSTNADGRRGWYPLLSATNLYSADGTLTGARQLNGASHNISFGQFSSQVANFSIYANNGFTFIGGGHFSISGRLDLAGAQVISSGSSSTVSNGVTRVVFDPSSTIASYTLNLPTTGQDGQVIKIYFGGTVTSGTVVTSLTITATGSGQSIVQSTTPTTGLYGQYISYVFNSSNSVWYREN